MIPFRHCIREPHGSAVKFEILAAAPNEFQVRYPDYDYIKMGAGAVQQRTITVFPIGV